MAAAKFSRAKGLILHLLLALGIEGQMLTFILEEDYDEGRAIAIATAKAEEWDENHPKDEN